MTIDEVINYFKRNYASGGTDDERQHNEALDIAIKALEQQPAWISVGERLPEDRELILFSTKTDRVFEGRYFDDNTDRQWYSFRDDTFAWNNVVTAWMPLPEPYKEDTK